MTALEIHPSAEELAAFTLGQLDQTALAAIETHLATCVACQERAAALPGDSLVELLRSAHTSLARASSQTPTEPQGTIANNTVSIAPPAAPTQGDGTIAPGAPPTELAHHERYRIVRLLGAGGMGSVYEAEHRVMQRPVALKVINPAFTSCSATLERFRREVRAAARLAHPNIVTTYDAEDAGSTLFLVMEYVEGISLGRLVKEQGPLPSAAACHYVRQAALGLQHAHERGMVHRDVKPDNLILVQSDAAAVVKVLDFGLAVLTTERSDSELTGSNVVMGTPDYMAPEQAEDARSADIRADVYSLGCTLYYLLTGSVPYPAATMMQKILAHREKPLPSLSKARPDVPPGLVAVVTKILAKQPAQRFQTPGEVAAALAPFTVDAQHPPVKCGRKRGWLVGAAMLLFGLILAAGVVVYRIQTDYGELVITTVSNDVEVHVKQGGEIVEILDLKTKKKLTLRSGKYDLELKKGAGLTLDINKANLTRGDTVLAHIERVPKMVSPPVVDAKTPALSQIQPLHRRPFPQRGGYCAAAVAPDGKFFSASWSGASIVVWEGRSGKELYRLPEAWHCFTPDGARLVAAASDRVRIHDAASGKNLHEIFLGEFPSRGVHVLPDNRHLVALTAQGKLHLGDMQTGKIRHTWPSEETPSWTPDGTVLFVKIKGEKTYLAWDVPNNKPSADFPARLAALPETKPAPTFSLRNREGKLQLWDNRQAKERTTFPLPEGEKIVSVGDPMALSIDSRYACVMTSSSVYLLRLPDPSAVNIKTEPPQAVEVFRQHWDGHVNSSVDLSPDGRLLVAGYWGVTRVWDVATGKPIRELAGWLCRFTPDGKRIVTVDKCVNVYDAESGKLLRQGTPSLPRGFWDVNVYSDGRRAITPCPDHVNRLWDLETGKLLHSWPLGKNPPPGAADTDGTYSLTCRGPRKLDLRGAGTFFAVDRASGADIARLSAKNFEPVPVSISRDGRFAAACARNQESDAVVWRLPDDPTLEIKRVPEKVGEVRTFKGHSSVVRRVFFANEGRHALSAGFDRILILWDVATGKEVRRFEGHTNWIDSAAVSRDSRLAISGGLDNTVRVWEVATGKELRQFKGNLGRVVSLAISNDGKRALTGSWDRTMRFFDMETGNELRRFNGHVNVVQAVAFSPDGLHALSGSWEKGATRTLKMFEVDTGRDLGLLFDGYAEGIQNATVSPDGTLVLSGGIDKAVRLWDAATGKALRSFEGHQDIIKSVAFAPDGRRALSGGDDRTVRLWDVATGEALHCFFGHTALVTSVAFSPDGRYALSGSDDQTMRLWRLPESAPMNQNLNP